jgi:hypothetical protein
MCDTDKIPVDLQKCYSMFVHSIYEMQHRNNVNGIGVYFDMLRLVRYDVVLTN